MPPNQHQHKAHCVVLFAVTKEPKEVRQVLAFDNGLATTGLPQRAWCDVTCPKQANDHDRDHPAPPIWYAGFSFVQPSFRCYEVQTDLPQ